MSNCEICGTKEKNLTEVKISGANMMVCSSCSDMGTKVNKEDEGSEKSTKYSTNTEQTKSSQSNSDNINENQSNSSKDMKQKHNNSKSFDDLSELALNFGDLIRDKRNSLGLKRSELAQNLGIKESHLESIENERTQPSVEIQKKIESELNIDLTMDEDF